MVLGVGRRKLKEGVPDVSGLVLPSLDPRLAAALTLIDTNFE
jgi:hypothetical protein